MQQSNVIILIIIIFVLSKTLPDLEGFPAAPNKSGTRLFCAKCKVFDDDDDNACDDYDDHAFTIMMRMICRYTASDYQGGTLVEGIAQSAKECQVKTRVRLG